MREPDSTLSWHLAYAGTYRVAAHEEFRLAATGQAMRALAKVTV